MLARPSIPVAILVALCVGGLLLAAVDDHPGTAFAPSVPDNLVVGALSAGSTGCQGPLPVTAAFETVQAWLSPGGPVRIEVRSAADSEVLATGLDKTTPPSNGIRSLRLTNTVSKGSRSVEVCLTNRSRRRIQIEGGLPTSTSGRLSIEGHRARAAMALLFLRPHAPSLLSALPSVFRRASLLKLSWAGAWAFWLLAAAVLAAFAVAGWAVVQADRTDNRRLTSDQ